MHAKINSRFLPLLPRLLWVFAFFVCAAGKAQTHAPTTAASEDTSQFLSATELEEEYALARRALQSQDWVRALVALEMVLATNPNYREANEMLIAARRGLEKDSTEARHARTYVAGMKAKRAGDLNHARAELLALTREQNNYRDAAKQLAAIEHELQTQTPQAAPENNIASEVSTDSLLIYARDAAARKDWKAAAALYAKLEALDPENLKLRREAERARVQLLIAQTGLARVEARGTKLPWLQFTIFICCLLLFVLLLYLAFSLRVRVRYYVKRNELRRAAQVYENALQRNPQRFNLYAPLAEIYVRANRTDAAAMKIFKTILDLNLPAKERQAIATLVSNQAKPGSANNTEVVQALAAVVRNAREQEERDAPAA